MEHLSQLEGFTPSQWSYEQVVYNDEAEGIDYWCYLHRTHQSDDGGIELEVTPDGGWCVYARWGVHGDERAFMTVEEAIDFWNNRRGE